MSSAVRSALSDPRASWSGVRMSAQQYQRLRDDGNRYELIDGVVIMSPSATPRHQNVAKEIVLQIGTYLRRHPIGVVLAEVDVYLGLSRTGGDLVYRPD